MRGSNYRDLGNFGVLHRWSVMRLSGRLREEVLAYSLFAFLDVY